MKKKSKNFAIIGVVCILFSLGAAWYAKTFQEGRILYPMDYSTYKFQWGDFPMWISIIMCITYVLAVAIFSFQWMMEKNTEKRKSNRLEPVHSKMGYLGFVGFLGFLGFKIYTLDGSIFPFVFFSFFGFFGFFFQGKMSNTLKDERFQENLSKAESKAYKIGVIMIWLFMLLLGQGKLFDNLEYVAIALTIVISLTMGLTVFLANYLLYKYDLEE